MNTNEDCGKRRQYLRGLKAAASGNAQAFGFSILITVSYGIAATSGPPPTLGEQIAFAMSAVAAFSLLNVLVAIVARSEPGSLSSKRVLLVATATDFIAVGAGLGAAIGIETAFDGVLAWVLIPFAAGLSYMLVQAIELALGREVDES